LLEAVLGDFPDDPNCAHLFNGLNIAQLRALAQFDHPGTAVQIVIALVMHIVHGIGAFRSWPMSCCILNSFCTA
jgi:hypothetical protein